MKKIRTLLTILITLSLVVVGCSSKSKNDNKTDNSKGYKIGIVTGEGGAKDKSFNQASLKKNLQKSLHNTKIKNSYISILL